MFFHSILNSTNNFESPLGRISCINKTLLEMHSQSTIDFSRYEFLKTKSRSMSWREISFKIVICMISIILSFVGNVITIYSMWIKPNLKKNSSANRDFYIQNISFTKTTNQSQCRENSTNEQGNNHNQSSNSGSQKKIVFTRVASQEKKNKPINVFILNLCFCDLMIVIWCSWVHMINSVSDNWLMGAFFCRFNTYVQSKIENKM